MYSVLVLHLVTLLGYVALDATPAISFNSGATTTTTIGAFSLNRDEIRTVRVVLKSTVHRRGAGLLLTTQLGILSLVELEGQTNDLVGTEEVALAARQRLSASRSQHHLPEMPPEVWLYILTMLRKADIAGRAAYTCTA